jgi:hypothetical protein
MQFIALAAKYLDKAKRRVNCSPVDNLKADAASDVVDKFCEEHFTRQGLEDTIEEELLPYAPESYPMTVFGGHIIAETLNELLDMIINRRLKDYVCAQLLKPAYTLALFYETLDVEEHGDIHTNADLLDDVFGDAVRGLVDASWEAQTTAEVPLDAVEVDMDDRTAVSVGGGMVSPHRGSSDVKVAEAKRESADTYTTHLTKIYVEPAVKMALARAKAKSLPRKLQKELAKQVEPHVADKKTLPRMLMAFLKKHWSTLNKLVFAETCSVKKVVELCGQRPRRREAPDMGPIRELAGELANVRRR